MMVPRSRHRAPKKKLISHLPASWIPYAELARIDKPIACLYLYFPCIFGTLLAASASDPVIQSSHLLLTNLIFLLGSFLVRCAGCTWNDIVDQDLDRQVERTKLRPIARRAITTQSALIFTVIQVLVGLGIIVLTLPGKCLWYSVPSILLTGLYPFGKRIMNYPQIILGCVFSWGVVMAYPAFDLDLDLQSRKEVCIAVACLFLSCCAWTMVYDTIYAAQDMKDDVKLGIGSPVAQHQSNTRILLMGAGLIQVALLCCTGVAAKFGALYFVGTCLGTSLILGKMVRSVNLDDPKDCLWWFKNGCFYTGIVIGSGFVAEYMLRIS